MPTSKDSLNEGWSWLLKQWVAEKKRAKETNDWEFYIWFLKEIKKTMGMVYAGFTNDAWIALFDDMFKTLSCELKESVIKSKNKGMAVKKQIGEMNDDEVLWAYKTGTKWLSDRQQVTGTGKNELGEEYNDEQWQAGLKRLEKLEDEIKKRGLAY